jgi:hypothetical protein
MDILTSSDNEDTAVRDKKTDGNTVRTNRRREARIGERDEVGTEGRERNNGIRMIYIYCRFCRLCLINA